MSDHGTFGGYDLDRRLSSSGHREVWVARNSARLAIVKRVKESPEPEAQQVLRSEATGLEPMAIARRRTVPGCLPSVPEIYGSGRQDGYWFVAMEYVDGTSLRAGTLSPREALSAVLFLARMLVQWQGAQAAPAIVHGDLKPGNVLRDQAGQLWVIDFGAARIMDGNCERDWQRSVLYCSPERLTTGWIDTAADRWALMAMFYELLNGQHPFNRIGESKVDFQPRPRSDSSLRENWLAVLIKGLDLDPGNRYQSAEALVADLEALDQGRTPAACNEYNSIPTQQVIQVTAPAAGGFRTGLRRHRVWIGLLAGAVAAYHVPILYASEKLAHEIEAGQIELASAYTEYQKLNHRSLTPLPLSHSGHVLGQHLMAAGRAAMRQGKTAEAIQDFDEAARTMPGSTEPYLALARVYAAAPNSALLLSALEQARRRGHQLGTTERILLGRAYAAEGDRASAAGKNASARNLYRQAAGQFHAGNATRLERRTRQKLGR
jgi:tetratricopeptide (TPR) repeat protein/tRNA A-37 threonylcarbamoyl transferase component Bud32